MPAGGPGGFCSGSAARVVLMGWKWNKWSHGPGGLGAALRRHLRKGGMRPSEAAVILGANTQAVRYHLRKMFLKGMATRTGDAETGFVYWDA